jgi:hypothetical protein
VEARLYPFGRLTHRIGKAFYQGPWEFLGVALPQRHQKSRPAKELWGSSWKRCFERSGTRRGQESRIIIADREWVPRSALPAPCSEALIYPFRPKMAKVEGRISMKMSSCRATLDGGSVTQHRPQYVDPPARQGDQSLSVPLAFSSLAIRRRPWTLERHAG